MSSQSPQRTRKLQAHLSAQGSMQTIAQREMSPSPTFRERQRAVKAHSMPAVPSVSQILASQSQVQQPSPTMSNSSHQSRHTPPPTSRISPTANKLRERSPDRATSPPPLLHSLSQPIVSQVASQTAPNPHHPRPVTRVPPPQFLTQYQTPDEKWQVTEELMAEFEREQSHAGQFSHPAGTSGVAYAGGAASSNINLHLQQSARDPAVERVRASDRASPKDSDGSSGGQITTKRQVRDKEQPPRESPKTRDRSATVTSLSSHTGEPPSAANRTPEYRGSPQYQTPMASPNERTATYTQYVPDSYQAATAQQAPSPSAPRKSSTSVTAVDSASSRLTPPATSKLASHTPPLLQAMAPRPPDRSLPVQEEPEEDVAHDLVDREPAYTDRHHSSPTPSSDVYPEGHASRYESHHDDDEETLNEEEAEDHLHQNKSGESSESGFTPRSPSATLPDRPREGQYGVSNVPYPSSNAQYIQSNGELQKTIRVKHRSGSTDQLGLRSFDPTMFENTVNTLRAPDPPVTGHRSPPQPAIQGQPDISRQQYEAARQYSSNRAAEQQRTTYSRTYPPQHPDDMQSVFDDPTSSYLQAFLQSPNVRPGAPVPPTPQTHTAAPSPSPAVSAMPSDVEHRQIGSPYPYPFTHIRRSTIAAPMHAPSSSFDMNHPAVVREQLALQMQIYALNNGLASASDSTFSPSSTPFPGPGYNPWTFMSTAGGGAGPGAATMSMRSSPSHEPLHLPMPPMRGRGLRRRDPAPNLRVQQMNGRRVKPPPRVDSTQPRETSPEPSSGEETAGEERFVDQYVRELEGGGNIDAEWNGHGNGNGNGNGNGLSPQAAEEGEWVDEEEEGEGDDLLELEFHPSFVSNPRRRRRRFDTRWDALVQAFQALDRETDATLVLLASPSHSTKLHALTSRSIRRDSSLAHSPALANIRTTFSHLASQRRAARSHRLSLVERLSSHSGSSAGDSPGNGELREQDLRHALKAALGSLGALGKIYEQREARWHDEMQQLSEDRERVELLLRQALGPSHANGQDARPTAQ